MRGVRGRNMPRRWWCWPRPPEPRSAWLPAARPSGRCSSRIVATWLSCCCLGGFPLLGRAVAAELWPFGRLLLPSCWRSVGYCCRVVAVRSGHRWRMWRCFVASRSPPGRVVGAARSSCFYSARPLLRSGLAAVQSGCRVRSLGPVADFRLSVVLLIAGCPGVGGVRTVRGCVLA